MFELLVVTKRVTNTVFLDSIGTLSIAKVRNFSDMPKFIYNRYAHGRGYTMDAGGYRYSPSRFTRSKHFLILTKHN